MNELVCTDFKTGKKATFAPKAVDVDGYKNVGHRDEDRLMVKHFIQAIGLQEPSRLSSDINVLLKAT